MKRMKEPSFLDKALVFFGLKDKSELGWEEFDFVEADAEERKVYPSAIDRFFDSPEAKLMHDHIEENVKNLHSRSCACGKHASNVRTIPEKTEDDGSSALLIGAAASLFGHAFEAAGHSEDDAPISGGFSGGGGESGGGGASSSWDSGSSSSDSGSSDSGGGSDNGDVQF